MTNEEKYKLTLFTLLRNQIMAKPCPEEPTRLMVEKYPLEHIDKVAYMTMLKCIEMVDFKRARKSFGEAMEKYE